VLPGQIGTAVYPGHGDFTFGAPVTLSISGGPVEAIIADFDGDGRRDIATVQGDGSTVTVLLNRGAFLFAPTDTFFGMTLNDVTVGDLNHDGRLDLLISGGRPGSDSGPGEGAVLVMPGLGSGAFGTPVRYTVPSGPMRIVAGDFNRDGIVDVATGNRSTITVDDCATTFKTWDSLSILVGRPDGMLAAPRNLAIGDQSVMDLDSPLFERYTNTLSSLNTSDLNGDHATELIATNGALFFNIPAGTNRAPTADFGPDQTIFNTHEVVLRPAAFDPDDDLLSYEIRDETGAVVATYPNACYTGRRRCG
jgi:hypothetical protein